MSYGTTVAKRIGLFGVLTICVGVAAGLLVVSQSQQASYNFAAKTLSNSDTEVEPFPIGVDPQNATITEQIMVNEFYKEHLATADFQSNSWWSRVTARLQTNAGFQMLASPVSRIIVIWPGERTEEITRNIGDVLHWDAKKRAAFNDYMSDNTFDFDQGTVPPGQYITHHKASPEDIMMVLEREFSDSVLDRYTTEIQDTLPLADALIIASLIEREASDFENMREISGVIWNRLFIDMPLQLDASLQYVKADNPYEPNWWPQVRPADKFIDSEFNTYQNKGLPPEPIANPSVEAIVAALNPIASECIFYFHSRSRDYYCSETYSEHKTKLSEVYGLN
ncbi:MAG: cell division protein YceG involved in septum cleavage [Candidatus Paceibacteria bacterium]|jgi:cell division protein YceG involved in septum cleavage